MIKVKVLFANIIWCLKMLLANELIKFINLMFEKVLSNIKNNLLFYLKKKMLNILIDSFLKKMN